MELREVLQRIFIVIDELTEDQYIKLSYADSVKLRVMLVRALIKENG